MAAGALSRSCLSYSAASSADSARDLLKPFMLCRHPSRVSRLLMFALVSSKAYAAVGRSRNRRAGQSGGARVSDSSTAPATWSHMRTWDCSPRSADSPSRATAA